MNIYIPELFFRRIHRNRREETEDKSIQILGVRVDVPHKEIEIEDGRIKLLANVEEKLRIFGINFEENMTISFTPEEGKKGTVCQLQLVKGVPVSKSQDLEWVSLFLDFEAAKCY